MPQPPNERDASNPWPVWPRVFGVDYGHAEVRAVFGDDPRNYSLMTKEFQKDEDGNVTSLTTIDVEVRLQIFFFSFSLGASFFFNITRAHCHRLTTFIRKHAICFPRDLI